MVFDPGIKPVNSFHDEPNIHCDEFCPEELNMISELFEVTYPGLAPRCPVVIRGDCVVGQNFVEIANCLFDSGALQSSYVSQQWVNQNLSVLEPYIREVDGGFVRLGDKKTIIKVKEKIRLEMEFTARRTGEVQRGEVDFWIFSMPGGHQAIIGLPDILRTFLYVFVEMLEDASEMLQQEDDEEKELFLNAMGMEELKELNPDLVEPW